jgi:hypothetical protein
MQNKQQLRYMAELNALTATSGMPCLMPSKHRSFDKLQFLPPISALVRDAIDAWH